MPLLRESCASSLFSIFSLREQVIKITRSPSFAVKECKNITPQVAFDFLFNGMHASLDALSFFHIRKTDETEVLAFDLNSIPFILKSIKETTSYGAIIDMLEKDFGTPIPSSTYELVSGEMEKFCDIPSFRKRWNDIAKLNKKITRTKRSNEDKVKTVRALKVLKSQPTKIQIFVAIDFETFEHDHAQITEIGISMFHSIRGDYSGAHILIKKALHLRNGRYVADNKDKYAFGSSIVLPMSEAKECLWEWLSDATAVIGHGMQEERRLLKELLTPQQFLQLTKQATLFDTQTMFRTAFPDSNRSSLSHVLEFLGIHYSHLHNAGNDARYSLMAFLRLYTQLFPERS